jgi:casein kinase 1, alpha
MCGEVFKGQCADSGEHVVIKTFNELKYYKLELQILKQLSEKGTSKNLAKFRGVGLYKGKPSIYLSRYTHDLQHHLAEAGGKLSRNSTVQVGLQMLSALEELHSIGILHADLKPDNIMVGRYDSADSNELFLIDFSLAIPYTHEDHLWKKPVSNA